MRVILILLLLANVALFALTRLDSVAAGEPQRLAEQVQPDKIQLLTAQQVAALNPAKASSLADVCAEWGPLGDADYKRALAELAPLNLGGLLAQRRVEADGFLVTLNGFASRAAAERRAAELRGRGIGDVAVIERNGVPMLSLGVFRTEQAANGRADALAQAGIAGTRVAPRTGGVVQSMIVVRDPPAPAMGRLRELAPAYPGTDVRVGACERAS
ncbi:MAG TPA: SPOR domain-containing protein [Casimicrobiaceae bacterium]|nr:SPOR domain-containing protein [Casimicrobiaceae bacterium]